MSLTPLWIVLAVLAVWSILIVFLVKKVMKGMGSYLECPPPNFMNTCKSAARYDFVNINYNKMIFTGIFILPLRLTLLLTLILITALTVLIIKLLFCGRCLSSSYFKEQPATKG